MAVQGTLFVVSAPSGGGKRTILSRVLAVDPLLAYSVSVTTRSPREGEVEGVDYIFVSAEVFDQWVREGRFAEWANVHTHRYGTPKEELTKGLASGRDLVLELDVQGMRSVRPLGYDMKSVFIMPPSLEELERRLRNRGSVDEAELQIRLGNAGEEMASRDEFDYVIVNDVLDDAVAEFEAIVAEIRRGRDLKAGSGQKSFRL